MKSSNEITSNQVEPISPQERQRREDAWKFARASVGLEGFTPSCDAEARVRQHINGEILLSDLVQKG